MTEHEARKAMQHARAIGDELRAKRTRLREETHANELAIIASDQAYGAARDALWDHFQAKELA